jgi:hypothetical protein
MCRRVAVAVVMIAVFLTPRAAPAQEAHPVYNADWVEARYEKSEHRIPMRDGVTLHTTVYAPRAPGPHPFLMMRTTYSCRPYGEDRYTGRLASQWLMREGYIFVCQDVRGRWMSEGRFDNMRPHVPGELPVDESSDTWDTIEWLLANVPDHNGRVGMMGVSYPGFYTAAAIPEAHPALVASSPQAPIADFYFDDFHHRGAYTLGYFLVTPLFGIQKEGPTTESWYSFVRPETEDAYDFFMELGPLSNADRYYGEENFFWQQLSEHPNYDEFWQARSILPHLRDVDHAVMTVGGWFDAEDLYGPLNIYREIERHNPRAYNTLVMGPWSHGQWQSDGVHGVVGDIWVGDSISHFYQREVEAPFFRHFLKGEGPAPSFEALMFDTGAGAWSRFGEWPPAGVERARWYLRAGERLAEAAPGSAEPDVERAGGPVGEASYTEYVSDPSEPVPHTDEVRMMFIPRAYMAEDQRFAERRPDVIEFMTPVLEEPLTLAGPITAHLEVTTTGTDADWVVKLIDVYPDSVRNLEHTPEDAHRSGMRQMVRSEIMRGRYRESFETPVPFVPGEPTVVEFPLQDVYHTFQPGHRVMIQIQSSWFPLFDRNPQTFVPNIFEAEADDFVKAVHRVWHAPGRASWVEVGVVR